MDDDRREERRLRRRLGVRDAPVLLGVERVDYTKGIPERLRAVDRLLTLHPELKRRFVLVQIGAPSRTHIPAYRRLGDEIDALVEQINWRHGNHTWQPIVYLHEHHSHEQLEPLYRLAQACVVSSLHDGMNLVAKEFVAARADNRGVLVLSRFAGAAQELTDALLINPFAVDAVRRDAAAGAADAARGAGTPHDANAAAGRGQQHLSLGRHVALGGRETGPGASAGRGPAGRGRGAGGGEWVTPYTRGQGSGVSENKPIAP